MKTHSIVLFQGSSLGTHCFGGSCLLCTKYRKPQNEILRQRNN